MTETTRLYTIELTESLQATVTVALSTIKILCEEIHARTDAMALETRRLGNIREEIDARAAAVVQETQRLTGMSTHVRQTVVPHLQHVREELARMRTLLKEEVQL